MVKSTSELINLLMPNGLRSKLKAKRSPASSILIKMEIDLKPENLRKAKRYSISEEVHSTLSNISTQEISLFHFSLFFLHEPQLRSCFITSKHLHHQRLRLDTQSKQFSILIVEKFSNTNNLFWFMSLQLSLLLEMNKFREKNWHLAAAKERAMLQWHADLTRMSSITMNGLVQISLLTILKVNLISLKLNSKFVRIYIFATDIDPMHKPLMFLKIKIEPELQLVILNLLLNKWVLILQKSSIMLTQLKRESSKITTLDSLNPQQRK